MDNVIKNFYLNGEFIRTESGFIHIVKDIEDYNEKVYYLRLDDEDYKCFLRKDKIVKHSKNIIDLIEAGDYVNGYKVDFVQNNEVIYNHNHPRQLNIFAKDIKTILTHEQFDRNCYRVEEER